MPSRAALLDRHAVALERTEAQAARQVAAAYDQARREILDKLITQWNSRGLSPLTPEQAASALRQSGLLQQIDGRLMQLEQELGINLRGIVTSSSELAIEQIRQEIALLPPSLRPGASMFGTINTQMVERFVPVAFNDVQLGTRSLSLTLQRELQTGLIQGQSFDSLAGRLFKATPGDVASPWRRGQLSADLATRRLVIAAENGSKQAAIGELQREIPEVQKQAIAAVGSTTTDCCLRVHGQIQPYDQPFILTGTPRFADELMTPPFHWNCRTSIAMHHPVFERSGLTTANMRKSAEAQLKKNEGSNVKGGS
jgi:hypothetical protein